MLTISFFENWDLEWYSRSGEMSFFDKLILGVCLLHSPGSISQWCLEWHRWRDK